MSSSSHPILFRVVLHNARIKDGPKTSGKPLTPRSKVWQFGFAVRSRELADVLEGFFRVCTSHERAVELAAIWQELVDEHEADAVFQPWAMEACHEIADVLEPFYAPGASVVIGSGSEQYPRAVRLPCRDCGVLFESRFRRAKDKGRGRFSRKCGLCKPYRPREPRNARSRVMYARGCYPASRPGIKIGAEQYGLAAACVYPGCDERFLTHVSNRLYCDAHCGLHPETRARDRRRSGA